MLLTEMYDFIFLSTAVYALHCRSVSFLFFTPSHCYTNKLHLAFKIDYGFSFSQQDLFLAL